MFLLLVMSEYETTGLSLLALETLLHQNLPLHLSSLICACLKPSRSCLGRPDHSISCLSRGIPCGRIREVPAVLDPARGAFGEVLMEFPALEGSLLLSPFSRIASAREAACSFVLLRVSWWPRAVFHAPPEPGVVFGKHASEPLRKWEPARGVGGCTSSLCPERAVTWEVVTLSPSQDEQERYDFAQLCSVAMKCRKRGLPPAH